MPSMSDVFVEASRLAAPLARRLDHYAAGLARLEPGLAEAYEEFVAGLLARQAGQGVPPAGEPFPDFVLPDEGGRLHGLDGLLAGRPLVISFNRGHWCSFCRLELGALAATEADLADCGAGLVAITPERQAHARRLRTATGLGAPLLADLDNGLALTLGLAVPVGDALRRELERHDVDLPLYQGNGGWLLPIPATFVVGADGRIIARHVDPDFRRRMEPEAILAALAGARPDQPADLSTER